MQSSKLTIANRELSNGNYDAALAAYHDFKKDNPQLAHLADFNISLIQSRISASTSTRKVEDDSVAKEKVIVYTCNFGNYEAIKEPVCADPSVEYILFTDNKNITSNIWKVIIIDEQLPDPRRSSRLAKILPHKYLPPHDISVYIDSSLEIKTKDIRKMVSDCMDGKEIALYKHYMRDCVYDEIDFVMNSTDRVVANKELCLKAIQKYRDIDYPIKNGLFENAFIFRRNTPEIRSLGDIWWKEYSEGTERDQFTLMYSLWKTGITPNAIKIGKQFRENPFVNFHQHKYKPSKAAIAQSKVAKVKPIAIKKDDLEQKKGVVNWVVGGEDNKGWAYENNAHRLIECINEYEHVVQAPSESDLAIYFDILLYDRMRVSAKQNIVRIGGPRPIERLCGDDDEKLRHVLSNFHSVICLNDELKSRLSLIHPNVHMIPNGIDLDKFSLDKRDRLKTGDFTIGFAGSVKSSAERDVKGLDYVIEAARIANVNLLNVGRGKGQTQIPHERMIEDFYSKIDILVHPVGPGREGSSNVIMEALALGIPVITTKHAGYHSERLEDGKNVLICQREAKEIAEKIMSLVDNKSLYNKLSLEGRKFVEHFHDVQEVSLKYKNLIESAISYSKAEQRISFVPFWLPVNDFASGRLRCSYISQALSDEIKRSAKMGYDPKAEIVVISQLASDDIYQKIIQNKRQFVIYDLCDRYYDDDRLVGGVNAKQRFNEIAQRANLIVTSTVELKRDIYKLKIDKPIIYIPDGIDFKEFAPASKTNNAVKTVGWFGNPGRGNLESAIWVLEAALRLGKKIKLITKKKSIKQYPSLYPYAKEWQYATFNQNLHTCDVIVVTHSKIEQNKSPNRLLTAVSKGVPVIASSSQSCERILKQAGLDWAIVNTEEELSSALSLLSNPPVRDMYFKLIAPVIEEMYGDDAIKAHYTEMLNDHVYVPSISPKKILFVSHNLSIGEGAPTSLYQTVIGLKKTYGIDATVFCPMTGEFKEKYEQEGIKVHNYTNIVSKDSLKPLNANFDKAKSDFQSLIKYEKFDMVICNTAKMLPYADFAIELGIPAISIIRESSDEHIDLTFSKNSKIIEASKRGLSNVNEIIFVSDVTRQLWKTRQFLPKTKVIHNGIITEHWDNLRNIDKSDLRNNLGLPLHKKILLSVGTINSRKAQIDIINSYQMLPAHLIEESYLVLVGARESEYLNLLKEEIAKIPEYIRNNILLVPETDNVADWYKSADIFVFSSHNESYPRVIIEALYFGLRIISSRVFGVAEQLSNNKSASIYEIGDIASLTMAIQHQLSCTHLSDDNTDYFYLLTTYHEMLNKYFVQISKHLNIVTG